VIEPLPLKFLNFADQAFRLADPRKRIREVVFRPRPSSLR
jgi:hypothetical protein